ncbi:MAG: peptidoglycan DD-metalloendopeptidase family protein [Firmicutes bacterium]|nr:peptidoglycan DD-metalloendopeptidase family protein [Bacillota bacterium]
MQQDHSPKRSMLIIGGVVVSAAIFMAAAFGMSGDPAAILVDGQQVAAVKDEKTAASIIDNYLTEQSTALQAEVFFAEDVTVSAAAPGSDKLSRRQALEALDEASTLMLDGAVILADGQTIASLNSEDTAKKALEYLKLSYLPEDSTLQVIDAKFAEDVTVQPTAVCVDDLLDLNEAKLAMKGQDGSPAPITVITVLEKTKTEDVPYETVYKTDRSLRYGQTQVKQAGVNGSREVTIQLVQTNGVETARQEISSNPLVAAVDEIILEGAMVQTASRSTTYMSDSGMIWPTTTTRISSYYGERGGGHSGLDIDGEFGDPVWAAKAGTVVAAGYNGSYGNDILIDHGGNVKTRYSHLQTICVEAGDSVDIGEQIGTEGSTGNSTGSHLHFEVIVSGDRVNPLPYIK